MKNVKSAHHRPYFRMQMVSERAWVLFCCASSSVVDLTPKQTGEGSSGSHFSSFCLETDVRVDSISGCIPHPPPHPISLEHFGLLFFFWYYATAGEIPCIKYAKQIKSVYVEFICEDSNELIDLS